MLRSFERLILASRWILHERVSPRRWIADPSP